MIISVISSKETANSIEISDAVFGICQIRKDVLQRVVRWQLAKRQSGNHQTKTRSDVSYSTKKIVKQKGSGGARHGDRASNIFRKGGTTKGPQTHSHAHDLNKKFRNLALRHALSSKILEKNVLIYNDFNHIEPKTKNVCKEIKKLECPSILFVDSFAPDSTFRRAVRNIPNAQTLPIIGLNVYDILRKEKLALTVAAIRQIEERLK